MNSYLVKYEASAIIIDQVVINAETKDDAINSAMNNIANINKVIDISDATEGHGKKRCPVCELMTLYSELDETHDPIERKSIIDKIENVKNGIYD